MKSKAFRLIFCVLVSLAMLSPAVLASVSATPRFLKQLKLMSSTDLVAWSHVPGNEISDFKLKIDPKMPWYYLDVMSLKPLNPIDNGLYGFTVAAPYPDGYFAYWASRSVVSGAVGWQGIMWQIINGNLPIFYLKVDGTDYMLVDGLQYAAFGVEQPLRVDGTYLTGTYSYVGSVASGAVSYPIAVQIVFK
jgi:hypothetical protein